MAAWSAGAMLDRQCKSLVVVIQVVTFIMGQWTP